jgi:hypothetical protein
MKNILLSIFGVLLYILSVYFTKTDKNGIEVYPIYYSAIIGGLTFVFSVFASVNLWKSNLKLVVAFLFFGIINLATDFGFALYNPYSFPTSLIFVLNIAKLVGLITYFWVIAVLWKKD